ncbi:MAG: hypothetical protein J0H25_12395 [Rhizobiales bacterium]|nr:hypothetical protein [Hyphomicrobiales bacterium]MBN9013805.1 hypothetical protein [Hyphomicrobiales bacterium]
MTELLPRDLATTPVLEAETKLNSFAEEALIVVAQNNAMNAIDLMIDAAGIDRLIVQLNKLKSDASISHLHIEDLGMTSPYGHETVFKGLILQWIGEPNFFGENNNPLA